MPHHPVHAKGYPSHGDAKDTIPVPSMDERAKPEGKGEGTTKFVDFKFEGDKSEWCGYARERLGRFVGLINKDGSTKTECGIHVEGAEKTFDRDLWDTSKTVNPPPHPVLTPPPSSHPPPYVGDGVRVLP